MYYICIIYNVHVNVTCQSNPIRVDFHKKNHLTD